MVSFSAVAKRYPGGQEAFSNISFSLEAGEAAFVTGRSGAGKTTLLKLIPAIERPTSGSVIVNGQNVGALKRGAIPYLRRNIGLVFQDQKLLYDRSVYDNVMLPLAFSAHPPKEAARRARAALDKVNLLGREKANPIQLSGGEQQRVAIARAFAGEPKLLMADEPTGNLDGATGVEVADLMFRLNREHGTTLLLVTHDVNLASRCARRLSLSAGRLVGDERAMAIV